MHFFIDSQIDITIIKYFSANSLSDIKMFLAENQMHFDNDFDVVNEFHKTPENNKQIRLKDFLFSFKDKWPERYNVLIREMTKRLYQSDFKGDKEAIIPLFKERGLNFDRNGNLFYSGTHEEYNSQNLIKPIERNPSIDKNVVIYNNLLLKIESYSNLDDILRIYVTESCKVASMGHMISAMVTLGAASERLFKLFVDAFIEFKTVHNAKPKEIENFKSYTKGICTAEKMKNLKNKLLSDKLFEQIIMTKYLSNKNSCSDMQTEINSIFAVFNIIRIGRNDAAHPTGAILTPDDFSANCAIFNIQLDNILNIINLIYECVEWQ